VQICALTYFARASKFALKVLSYSPVCGFATELMTVMLFFSGSRDSGHVFELGVHTSMHSMYLAVARAAENDAWTSLRSWWTPSSANPFKTM